MSIIQGHGHVTPRTDGRKASCGGLEFCAVCRIEHQAAIWGVQVPPARATNIPLNRSEQEHAAWLADKIVAGGDYAKEAAQMLRRWPAAPPQPVAADGVTDALDKAFAELGLIRLNARPADKEVLTHARKAIYDAISAISTQERGK